MVSFSTVEEVLETIQRVKAEAPAYCTNLYPVPQKLGGWLGQGRLFAEIRDGVSFIFKRECGFLRLYFCAASTAALQREMTTLSALKTEHLVVDLIGKETGLADLLHVFALAGFSHHGRLQRMARLNYPEVRSEVPDNLKVEWASQSDFEALSKLLHSSFDHYTDQLPEPGEVAAAIQNQQILTTKRNGAPAAMLFFETQGMTSAIRYWVVAREFRSCGLGSALMRQYLAVHCSTRRFILWVGAENQTAIRSYEHYGYAADGLIDHVLVNERIRP